MGIPMYVICCFSLVDLIFLSVWLVYSLVCCSSLGLSCLGLSYWIWVTVSFPMLRKFSTIISLNIFPGPKPFGTPVMQTLGHLLLSQSSLKLSSFHYLFFLYSSVAVISMTFFQLTYPFFCLIFSYWFYFFHLQYCIHQLLLFFIFYSSLLKICNFSLSILFLSSWIIPLIVTRNSFMGGLPMSLSCPSMVFIFFLHLKHIPLPSHFVSISSCITAAQSVMPDFLWPHGLQHTRRPCPSLSPWVYSNSCPLSQWCHPTISSSVVLFSSCPQSFPASGFFFSELAFHIMWPKYWCSSSAAYFYVSGTLCFSTLEKWHCIGAVLCVPAVHAPLVMQGPGTSWSQGRLWSAFADLVPHIAKL